MEHCALMAAKYRFPSVLGRIGLAWFFAGIIYLGGSLRWQIGWFFFLLVATGPL